MTGRVRRGGLVVAALVAAVPAAAQVVDPAASPTPAAIPVPAPPVIVLPTPTPSASASVIPMPPPPRAAARRANVPTPTPAAIPTPAPTAPVTPTPSPVAASPSPTGVATPGAVATDVLSVTRQPDAAIPAPASNGWLWYGVGIAALAAAGALAWAWSRRSRRVPDDKREAPIRPEPPPPPPAPASRARLTLALRPLRAGINLLSAICENEVVVTNDGDLPAEDIRVQLRLFSAHVGLDAELVDYLGEAILRPAVPAFALGAGESRSFNVVAAMPREAIRPLTAAGRPMFVPIVAVNIVYATGDGAGQTAQAFAVGVERVDSSKLAPFWLDVPARRYDQVAARPHSAVTAR